MVPEDVRLLARVFVGDGYHKVLAALSEGERRYIELRNVTNYDGGALYTPLSTLERLALVKRKKRGVYAITERGRKLYKMIQTGELWNRLRAILEE